MVCLGVEPGAARWYLGACPKVFYPFYPFLLTKKHSFDVSEMFIILLSSSMFTSSFYGKFVLIL